MILLVDLPDWLHRMSMFDIALDYQRERDRFPRLRQLDYRELQMARLVAAGCTGREAGVRMGLNAEAAEAMHRQLLVKLGVETDEAVLPLVGRAAAPEFVYVDDFRVSYFRPTTDSRPGDVVFAD